MKTKIEAESKQTVAQTNEKKHVYPDDDTHPFALGSEWKNLQDAENKNVTIRSPKAHARQISVHQRQTHAFSPCYQGNLKEKRIDKTYCTVNNHNAAWLPFLTVQCLLLYHLGHIQTKLINFWQKQTASSQIVVGTKRKVRNTRK